MKPTQEQVISWAREVCMPFYYQTGEIAGLERLEQFATLAYEAGRKDENEAAAKVCELIAINAADTRAAECAVGIRARREQ